MRPKLWLPTCAVLSRFRGITAPRAGLPGPAAAGADGYLLEGISRDGLQHSLLLVTAGEKVFPSELATVLSTVASVRRERPTRRRSRPRLGMAGYERIPAVRSVDRE